VDLPHWRCTECLDASMAIEEPMEAEDDRQIVRHVRHTPPPLRHAPVASVTPTAPLANSSVGYFQLGFSFGGNNTATETTGLSHVILESTCLSDGPGDATTSLDASVDDSRDDVSDALQNTTDMELTLPPMQEPRVLQEDSIADVTHGPYESATEATGNVEYKIQEDTTIRGRHKLFDDVGFSYTAEITRDQAEITRHQAEITGRDPQNKPRSLGPRSRKAEITMIRRYY
ncbi:hypothetical protein LSAT2_027768, partial [Lamellibrachia satsuma]